MTAAALDPSFFPSPGVVPRLLGNASRLGDGIGGPGPRSSGEQIQPAGRAKLRVAFVGHKGYPATYGGVEKAVEGICNGLADRGHECIVYSRRYYSTGCVPPKNVRRIVLRGLQSKRLDTLSHTLLSLIDVIRRDVDIVSLHSLGNAVLDWIPKLRAKKVVVHIHGFEWDVDKWNRLDKLLLRLPLITLARFSDAVTTVSLENRSRLAGLGIDALYIPNGVSVHHRRMSDAMAPARPYVLFVGRLVPQKGVELLIRAFREIRQSSVDLLIVGEHNAALGYFDLLRRLAGGDERIRFLGYRFGDELASLYAHAYCVVIPSEIEANPLVLLESLAHRKCVLAARIPGIVDVAGDVPIYFESGNWVDLRRALESVVHSPTLVLEREHDQRVTRVVQSFHWSTVLDCYEDLFWSVMEGRSPTQLFGSTIGSHPGQP